MSASYNEAKAMIGNGVQLSDAAEPHGTTAATEPHHRLRLLIVMAQGPAGALPEAWQSYPLIEDARASALEAPKSERAAGRHPRGRVRTRWIGQPAGFH